MTSSTVKTSKPSQPKVRRPTRARRSGSAERRRQLVRAALYTRIAAGALVLLIFGVVFAIQLSERDQIRSGVHAFGVDLGGMNRDEARAALLAAAQERTGATLTLTDGETSWTLDGDDLGLRIDVDGAVDDAFATGREGWGPSRLALLWHMRSGKSEVGESRIGVDSTALNAQLATLADEIFQQRVDPALSFSPDTGVSWTPTTIGRALDRDKTGAAILAALASGKQRLALTIDEDVPPLDDADFATAKQQLENIFDAPIDLIVNGETWTLTQQQISNWLTLTAPTNGQPAALTVNETWIDDVVWEITLATDRLPRSPRIWWDGGGNLVKTADGSPGRELQRDAAREMVHSAFLGHNNNNRLEMPVKTLDLPPLPADMNQLGISTMLAEASTPYGGGLAARMHNIELAASLLNGTVVMPGQTFSFNAEVGPTTLEAGFQEGYGIANENGVLRTVPSEAGGICQVATTVFQPVFWTGYQIEQRSTHSYWINNYASNGYVGLDATVDEATGLDFKWVNNTSTAVMIEAATDGQTFTVRLYGTPPPWRVEVDPPEITNVKEANEETVYEPSDTIPDGTMRRIESAQDGFDVKVVRRVIEGDQVRSADFVATYGAARNVILVGSTTGELPEGFVAPD